VVGGADVGAALVEHPEVARVAFTGSTGVGQAIATSVAPQMKRVSFELGGCDPFVLLADADLAGAVRAIMGSRFFNAGQVCVAPKRLIVDRSVADDVIERLTVRLARINPGPGLDPSSTMGPMHTEAGRDRLEAQIADAADRGATVIGGDRPADPDLGRGWFINPALVIDPPPGAQVRTEETFGPALTIFRVDDPDEAVEVANETPYSLGCSVWSADQRRAMELAHRIPAGYTWINALARVYDELPFGGVGLSGVGREHGTEALESYTEARSVVIGGGR
jgi:succinate-semialdehyde dehydrogenase/glutarate-semialdehyde dehydrogenase